MNHLFTAFSILINDAVLWLIWNNQILKTNSTNFVNFFSGMHQDPSPSFEFILKLHVCLQKLPLSSRYKRFCDILKMKIEILNEHFFRIFKRSLKTLIFYNSESIQFLVVSWRGYKKLSILLVSKLPLS